ncbi:Sporulation-specific protein 71 [Cyberlindnera fabianii]|uniref:Sporulation-specific protein 71 n=2 Tax=Cyberlindnera fabianii TaxID=36022 RepID=A0A1V2LE27_CYBFA|nr:Sporulation-specific protein 71 [Cyberlindnera fabianii]
MSRKDTTGNSKSKKYSRPIKLPPNSFTASRFLYGNALEISDASEVVLLGGIPNMWSREHKSSLLKKWTTMKFPKEHLGLNEMNCPNRRLGLTDASYGPRARKVIDLMRPMSGTDEEDDEEDKEEEERGGHQDGIDSNDKFYDLNRSLRAVDTESNQKEPDVTTLQPHYQHTIDHKETVVSRNGDFSEIQPPKTSVNGATHIDGITHPQTLRPSLESRPESNELVNDTHNNHLSLEDPSTHSVSQSTVTSTTEQSFYTAHGSASSLISNETIKGPDSPMTDTYNHPPTPPDIVLDQADDDTDSTAGTIIRERPESSTSINDRDTLKPVTPNQTILSEYESDMESDIQPKVRFTSTGRERSESQSTSRILQLRPTPETNVEIGTLDPRREITFEKVITVASKTKRMITKDMKKVRQKQLYRRFMKHFVVGEIIKMEKMLVLVKTPARGSNLAGFTQFTEMEPCDTRVLEKWKEYIVVARSTGDSEKPVLLQFYTNREIPDSDDSKHSKGQLDFTLTKSCFVNLYSTLDRTISLLNEDKVFILRCQTPTSSIRWLTFFNEVLGNHTPRSIKVDIPNVNISINLNFLRTFFDRALVAKFDGVSLEMTDNGYRMSHQPLVQDINLKVRQKLINAGFADAVERFDRGQDIVGVCWRHYDRLEWLFAETLSNLFFQKALYFTHELEIRFMKQYPRVVTTDEGVEMKEPTPIEGFLIRLSTREGNLKRGLGYKQVIAFDYFSTSDHLLCFSKLKKATPPIPFSDELFDSDYISKIESLNTINSSIDAIFYNNPYKLDRNGHVEWLNDETTEEQFNKRDLYALYDFERRINLVRNANDLVDLLEVETIDVFDPNGIPLNVELTNNLMWGIKPDLRHLSQLDRDTYFAIHMKNGSKMVLKAQTTELRDEWITRLTELKSYWEKRCSEDGALVRALRDENAIKLNINDPMEADAFEMAPKWEASRGEANPEIFNVTPYSLFRPIIRSGVLFQKPKKHSTFRKYFVVAVPGYLLLYKMIVRDFAGRIKPTTHYKHYITVPLSDCYIYSGQICEMDLLKRDVDVDNICQGKSLLPRVYEDGWLSSDDEPSRCFTLWFGSKRAISGKSLPKTDPDSVGESRNPSLIKMVSRLGVTGQSVVFMCKSRQERDIWVTNLYTELERFGRANER